MLRNPYVQACLLTLLCVTLLLGRLAGAHVHLCFDGNEPPVSFHLSDNGLHHDAADMAAPHADVDLTVASELLSKAKFELALLAAVLVFGVLRTARLILLPFAPRATHSAPCFLLPLQRGPPLR